MAERFLRLTPDEIYELAQRASGEEAVPTEAEARAAASAATEAPPTETPQTFSAIVERVTEALTKELALPTFDEWAAAYRDAPSRYDEELLGLWRERLE